MIVKRPLYLSKLINGIGSGQIKVVTGIRRCGKSFLVFNLFKEYLIEQGVQKANIIEMSFDRFSNKRYRNPSEFYPYIKSAIDAAEGKRFVLLDEVQLLDDFSEVLIDLMSMSDVEIYVTGNNARLLSRDVATEFRGRGQEIHLAPFTFGEFMSAYEGDRRDGYMEYATYGGLPAVFFRKTPQDKTDYLRSLYDELYIRDIVDRNGVRDQGNLEGLIDVLSSAVGSLTNASKISATFKSEKRTSIAPDTVDRYLSYLEDSFLVSRAKRYDLKGRRYIGTPYKYYFTDLGLRNARMNFRQMEMNHIMENVVYNELKCRGYGVDVGLVPSTANDDGKVHRKQLEIDFVCNSGSKRYYIQSAFEMPSENKREQEERPLLKVDDGFKKVIVTSDGPAPHYDERGVLIMNIFDFLLDANSLDF